MKTIEQLLSAGDVFRLDPTACMQHSDIVRAYVSEDEKFPWSAEPLKVQLVFKVSFIAICHQFNWDFLQNALARNLLGKPESIITLLSKVNATTIAEWLSSYPKKERIRAKERARLLRDVAATLEREFDGDQGVFYDACSTTKLSNRDFHNLMDKFEGFRTDQLRKKTNILSHDLMREKIVTFPDPQNLEPAVDYHIMRLYLRTGRVIPSNQVVFRYLEGAPNPRGALVRELRKVTAEAVKLTSSYSGLSVADLNYVEWQIGRAICLNDLPLCDAIGNAHEFAPDVRKLTDSACPYRNVCLSRNQLPNFMAFEEPNFVSSDY